LSINSPNIWANYALSAGGAAFSGKLCHGFVVHGLPIKRKTIFANIVFYLSDAGRRRSKPGGRGSFKRIKGNVEFNSLW
jgi:hypothetical protein